jgi:hypothetical protein
MSSDVGLGMMLDVLAAKGGTRADGKLPVPCQCAAFTEAQIGTIVARGVARNEAVPEVHVVMDTVVSPIIYRALFAASPVSAEHAQALVASCMKTARSAKQPA